MKASYYQQLKLFALFYITSNNMSNVAVNLYMEKRSTVLSILISTLCNDEQTAKRRSVLSPHGVGESMLHARGASCCGCIYI